MIQFVTAVTITLSSFLMFVVQPLLARELLPSFGGSPMVWATTMLFFQAVLLTGYAYAYTVATRLSHRLQRGLHLGLLAFSLFFLPLSLSVGSETAVAAAPALSLLRSLAGGILLPAVLLASTNPLIQAWLEERSSESVLESRRIYRWFALSNLGSLGGLLSYPFAVEPNLSLTAQRNAWSVGYLLFVGFNALLAWALTRGVAPRRTPQQARPALHQTILWIALAAAGSWLYLATTNQITRNVAPVPFLWVAPLALYLLSFIVCFESDRWYHRAVWLPAFAVSTVAACYLLRQRIDADYVLQLSVYLAALFSGVMLCHGELARLRPAAGVSGFYLKVALGGVFGGLGVSLLAPWLFTDYWEFPLGFLWVVLLLALRLWDSGGFQESRLFVHSLVLTACVAMVGFVTLHIHVQTRQTTLVRRNFFGVLRAYDRFLETPDWRRDLWNGGIGHGGQYLDPARRLEPTMYFGPNSGIGVALSHLEARPGREGRRVAVLGLGVGTLASYGRAGDTFVFYELNPDVFDVAQKYFFYLSESPASTEVRVGDGRRSLQREQSLPDRELYDALVMDAFTGDAIPVHLLTREAFAIYRSRLHDDGILAVNISNLHFDLRPVLRAQAKELGAVALFFSDDGDGVVQLPSDWVIITANAEFIAQPTLLARVTPWSGVEVAAIAEGELDSYVWTDDYSDVFRVLR